MTDESANHHQTSEAQGRTFILYAGFLGTLIGGYWLGLMIALVTGIASADPPLFPGEYLAGTLLSLTLLVGLYVLVHRADGRRLVTLSLLFVAAFAILNVLCSLYLLAPLETLCILPSPDAGPSTSTGKALVALQDNLPQHCRPSPPAASSPLFWVALTPAVLVTALLCSAALFRNSSLQLSGILTGSLFALAGLLLSLVRAFM